ncbi:MAG: SLC13/DASS family transporter [Lawsonibacter sp.]|jgi:sodium-dependent dicarboxylate transporter 2/3/5|nr:SLC13/DASS family transporter [Lawsonibacter sp.]
MNPMSIALLILVITVALFIWEPIPIIVTAIGASIAFAYTGLIEVGDIFTGYNSTTIVLLAGMMVVGSSLFHAGITDMIGEKMVKVTGKSERNIILATLVVSCVLSAVCSNIGVMTAMAPLVTAMCLTAGIGPSKALLALLFGAQFGGFVTLVGVGSNATANSVMAEQGIEPFGFFSITPFGIGVCILGTLYFTFIGRKLIPDTGYVPEFAKTDKKPLDKRKAFIAVATLLCVLVVIAVSPKNIPMHVAAVVGALVIVGTKCMSVQDAIKAIDWNCMLLVGSLTAISNGVKNSGLGTAAANAILDVLGENPSTFMITTLIFFAAALLTQIMSNIPTIMLFMPIGISIAEQIGVSPYPIAMTITLAGAASYATPFAAPQNMMTVGWTRYRFVDFIKIGLPMLLITYVVVVALVPIFLPY